jgi:hypothetical protein
MPLKPVAPTKTSRRKLPKTEAAPTPQQPKPTQSPETLPTNTRAIAPSSRQVMPLYNTAQVAHNLNFPEFNPDHYFARNLFTVSSPLQRTTKSEADRMVQEIEEQRQTVRVVQANLGLNRDIVKAGSEQQKLVGDVIDYGTIGMRNQTKFIQYQIAGTDQATALVKLDQSNERFNQEETILNGMLTMTPLIAQEWQYRQELKRSKIEDLRTAVLRASSQMDERLSALSSEFQQDMQSLGS